MLRNKIVRALFSQKPASHFIPIVTSARNFTNENSKYVAAVQNDEFKLEANEELVDLRGEEFLAPMSSEL